MRTTQMALAAIILGALIGCGGTAPLTSNSGHPGGGGRSDTPALDRLFTLRPFHGVIYKPAPSDYKGDGQGKYYDSDFCNDDFKGLWGPTGRNDLQNLANAGAGFIHIYDWNQPGSGRSHVGFLNYCNSLHICVAVPISRYFVLEIQNNNANAAGWIKNIVQECYPNGKRIANVVMWSLGNEYDQNDGQTAAGIAKTAQLIVQAEDSLGIPENDRPAITSPVTFGRRFGNNVEGVGAVMQLRDAFTAAGIGKVWTSRFVAAVNSFNPGSDLSRWIGDFQRELPTTPFVLFEMGKEIGGIDPNTHQYDPNYGTVNNEAQQGQFYADQLSAVMPLANTTNFLGPFVFSFVNEAWKGATEATHGVYAIGTPGGSGTGRTKGGDTYPIDTLVEKPNFAAMKRGYGK